MTNSIDYLVGSTTKEGVLMKKSINLLTDLSKVSDNKLSTLWGNCLDKLAENRNDEVQQNMKKKIYGEGCKRGYVLAQDIWGWGSNNGQTSPF